jgi:hypothetical protein
MVRGSAKWAVSRAGVVLLTLFGVAFCSAALSAVSLAAASPTIESVSVSGITEHDATLEAQINTQGSYTGYWFQIDTNSSYDFTQADCPFDFPDYAECDSIAVGEPLPAGLVEPHPEYIQAGSGDQLVKLDLASIGATLEPATTYHYRVLASSGGYPIVVAPDQTFETRPDLSVPTGESTGTLPGAIEPLPVNPQIEKEFWEHPPWDRVHSSAPAEAAKAAPAVSGNVTPACTVPSLKGDSLAVALRALLKAHCGLGTVSRPHKHHRALIVNAQKVRAGRELAQGAAVAVRLGPVRG